MPLRFCHPRLWDINNQFVLKWALFALAVCAVVRPSAGDGDRPAYLMVTMDRVNFPGMPAPNWTYGELHLPTEKVNLGLKE